MSVKPPDPDKIEELIATLSQEQKDFIDQNWDKLKLVDLVRQTFKDDKLDARCKEYVSIKAYLGSRTPQSSRRETRTPLELTDDQKEGIRNNVAHIKGSLELARLIFEDPTIKPLSMQQRAVFTYLKTLPEEITGIDSGDDVVDEYKPINTLKQVIDKVNSCLFTDFREDNINAQQKKVFEAIRSFLRAPRFLHTINSYSSKSSRKIFEEEFVRTVFDKPDLVPDELNLCINLCSNYVVMITVNRHLDLLNDKYEKSFNDPTEKVSQALAEMIKAKTGELNACDLRQQKIIAELNGSRAKRNEKHKQTSLSFVDIVAWWKNEDERRQAIERERKRRLEVEEEVDRLEDISELKARIAGFTKGELTLG